MPSRPPGWVVLFFVYGATAVPFAALLLAWPLNLLLGEDSAFRSNALIPLLEETLKVAPLLLYLALRSWRFRWTAGAADLLILVSLIFERLILARHRERTRAYALDRANLRLLKGGATGTMETLSRVLQLRIYLRERRGLTHGLYLYHASGADTTGHGPQRLDYLKRVSATLSGWKARVEVTPSLPWAEMLANVIG